MPDALAQAARGTRAILCLAGPVPGGRAGATAEPELLRQHSTLALATLEAAARAAEQTGRPPHVFLASSAAVYGAATGLLCEDQPLMPLSTYGRAKAEMDNLRRRSVKDVENAHKFGIEKFVNELLPVLDSMGLGLATEDASAESLREGMELTMNMLVKMMEKLGIEEIDPLNEKFDPEKHQAMTMQPNADVEPNTVIAVMQKGYSLNERLIRPAMVMVSKAAE